MASAQEGGMLPAKPPGVVRVGVVMPKVQGSAGNAAQVADTARNLLADNLNGPTLEVLLLNSRSSAQSLQEARLGDCDYVVFSILTHKKGGTGGLFGQTLNNVANAAASTYIPDANPVSSAAMNGALQSAADYAATVQARDEMRLDYKLQAVGAQSPALEKSMKQKAQEDGQDLMTPLIENAAEAIGAAVTKN
jgi:hypothetical protein